MSSDKKQNSEPGLIQTLSSLQFGIVILITVACVAIIGTIIPQGRPPAFYEEHYGGIVNTLITVFRFDNTYRSPLFIGLLALFGLNLILCSIIKFPAVFKRTFRPDHAPAVTVIRSMPVSMSVNDIILDDLDSSFTHSGFSLRHVSGNRLYGEKGRFGYLGSFTVHVSLLLLLIGGMTSLLTGLRGHIVLVEGETADSVSVTETISVPLGFKIRLDNFDVRFYEDFPGRPKSYTSSVTVTTPDGATFAKDIRVNSPLMLNDFTVYQSSYGLVDDSDIESAADDTARVAVRLKGSPENMPPVATFDMVKGETYPVPGFGDSIRVRITELHRNFNRGGASEGELNPAVKIDILTHGTVRWSVYSFVNFPGLNMPMYEDLPLSFSMLDLRMSESSDARTPESESYYTVLGVVRDRGIPFMWAGSIVMMIGLVLSFYIRPVRIWAVEENGTIYIGGRTKGDPSGLESLIKKTVVSTKNAKQRK